MNWLGQQVDELGRVTQAICTERINGLKREVNAGTNLQQWVLSCLETANWHSAWRGRSSEEQSQGVVAERLARRAR